MPFANVNGVKLNYSVIGEGEPVILITGFGGDINFFHSLVPELSDKYKVIIFENRGMSIPAAVIPRSCAAPFAAPASSRAPINLAQTTVPPAVRAKRTWRIR